MPEPEFTEDWYPDAQLVHLVAAFERVRHRDGAVVEIGCWEGKSTIALANACYPELLLAVDTWAGSLTESADHPTVLAAQSRDVYATFLRNITVATRGNVRAYRLSSAVFFAYALPLKFCHLDGAHDYASVAADLDGALRTLVSGGLLCGDDFQSDQVSRAVRERLPGVTCENGRFWSWMR